MVDGENGNFELIDNQSTIYASLSNPAFGSNEVHNFCIPTSGIDEVAALNFSIIPNPSTGHFNVVINTNDEKTLRVFDITGRLMMERKTAEQSFALDLSNQSKGVYILQIETINGNAVEKLVLK